MPKILYIVIPLAIGLGVWLFLRHRRILSAIPDSVSNLKCNECGKEIAEWNGQYSNRIYRLTRKRGAPAIVAIIVLRCAHCDRQFDYLYCADQSLTRLAELNTAGG